MLGLVPPRARRFAPQRVNSLALPTLTNRLYSYYTTQTKEQANSCSTCIKT